MIGLLIDVHLVHIWLNLINWSTDIQEKYKNGEKNVTKSVQSCSLVKSNHAFLQEVDEQLLFT